MNYPRIFINYMIQLSDVDMMKTKTIKTPLMMAEAYSLSVWPSNLAQKAFQKPLLTPFPYQGNSNVPRLSHHEWQKQSPFGLKNRYLPCAAFLVSKASGVFPLLMSIVAKQRVMMAGLVRELAHRHTAVTAARMLEEQRHQQRGF